MPISATFVMMSDEPLAPELVMVTYCSVVGELTAFEVNVNELADTVMAGGPVGVGLPVPPVPESSPVPPSYTACGEPGASSSTVIEALRAPGPRGVKTTVTEQEAFGA